MTPTQEEVEHMSMYSDKTSREKNLETAKARAGTPKRAPRLSTWALGLGLTTVIGAWGMSLVRESVPVQYATRAYSKCSNHEAVNHRLASISRTEVSMMCGAEKKTIAVKCVFGWGILADTVCHENN